MKKFVATLCFLFIAIMTPVHTYANENTQTITNNYIYTASDNELSSFKISEFTLPQGETSYVVPIQITTQGKLDIRFITSNLDQELEIYLCKDKACNKIITYDITETDNDTIKFSETIEKAGTYYIYFGSTQEFKKDLSVQCIPIFYNNLDKTLRNDVSFVSYNLKSTDQLYYKVVLNSSGFFTFYANTDMNITLCDQNKKALTSTIALNADNSYSSQFILSKGTYYIKTTAYKNLSKVKYTFEKVNDTGSTTKKKAQTISSSANGVFTLSSSSQSRWYKFKLSGSKKISIQFSVTSATNPLVITVYDANGHILPSGNFIVGNNETLLLKNTTAWSSGIYYIKVSPQKKGSCAYYTINIK